MEQIPDPTTPEGFPTIVPAPDDGVPEGRGGSQTRPYDQTDAQPQDAENRGIVRAAAVLAVGNVASRVLGLAREMVKANLFGTTPLLAAFQAVSYTHLDVYKRQTGWRFPRRWQRSRSLSR